MPKNILMNNVKPEVWNTLCHAENSRAIRSAEMFFVKDTPDVWDFTSHFQLSKAQDGGSKTGLQACNRILGRVGMGPT